MNFMTPIESPNLPKRGIALAAVSIGAVKAKEYLLARGISVFDILPCAAITDGTAAHADLHLLHLGGRKILKWDLMCRFSTLRSAINIPPMCRSMPRFSAIMRYSIPKPSAKTSTFPGIV